MGHARSESPLFWPYLATIGTTFISVGYLNSHTGRTNMLSIVAFGVALAIGMSGAAFAQTSAPAPQDFDKPALLNTNSLAVKKSSIRSSQLISNISKKESSKDGRISLR
jgi:hypothetical protein